MSKLVIGLLGYANAGKTYFAQELQTVLEDKGMFASRLGFSEPIYRIFEAFGFDYFDIKHDKAYRHEPQALFGGKSVYDVMVLLGQQGPLAQAINPNIYVDIVKAELDADEEIDVAIVENVRFENEAEFIKSYDNHAFIKIQADQIKPSIADMNVDALAEKYEAHVIDNSFKRLHRDLIIEEVTSILGNF